MSQWNLQYAPDVVRWLRKADPHVARRVRDALTAVVATGQPRSRGKALTGPLAGLWRYRVGDWRDICDIHDEQLTVLALDAGHRSEIYD